MEIYMYYSAKTNGFYDPSIHEAMPSDVVEITTEMHNGLLEAQTAGKFITSDSNGFPVAIDQPEAPFEESAEAYMKGFRLMRESLLNRLAGIGVDVLSDGNAEKISAWKGARQTLLDIPSDDAVKAAIIGKDFNGLKLAVKTAYRNALQSVPDWLKLAFNNVDD